MELNYLKDFLALAEKQNFSEAADVLSSTPSSISKHLKKIEKYMGVVLIDRTSRNVNINDYGKIFLNYADQIITLQDQFHDEIEKIISKKKNDLRIGSLRDLIQYNITDIIGTFKKEFPHSHLEIMYSSSEQLLLQLQQKKCDLAFIRSTNEVFPDLEKIPYATDHMIAVFPSDHPLANEKFIQLPQLQTLDILFVEEQMYVYKLFLDICHQFNFEPNIVYKDNRFENLIELVKKGMGVALLMKPLVHFLNDPQIKIIEIKPKITTNINLCYTKENQLAEIAWHFIECTKTQREKNLFLLKNDEI